MIINGGLLRGGTYSDANIVKNGLVLNLDAIEYPGSGTTWPASVGPDVALSNPAPVFTKANPTYLDFSPASNNWGVANTLGDLTSWTVEAWFRTTADLSTTNLTSIVTTTYQDLPTTYNAINFCLTNYLGYSEAVSNGINVAFWNNVWHNCTPMATTPGTWYNIIGTYDGTTLKQYENGTFSNQVVVGSPSSANGGPVRIGRRWDTTLDPIYLFPGDIAVVRVYNTALTSGQVAQNYNEYKGRFGL